MASGAQTDLDKYRDDHMYIMRLTSSFTTNGDGAITVSMKRGKEITAGKVLLFKMTFWRDLLKRGNLYANR